MKTDLQSLIATFVGTIRANLMGGVVVTDKVLGKNDLAKGRTNNRSLAYQKFYDETKDAWRIRAITRYTNISFQRNYENACTNRADTTEKYIAEKPKGMSWVNGLEGILLVSDTDPNKFYLRINENKNTTHHTTYFIDGKEATAEEVAIIKEHLPKRNNICKKQLDFGIAEDDMVVVKSISLENIASIKFGQKMLILK